MLRLKNKFNLSQLFMLTIFCGLAFFIRAKIINLSFTDVDDMTNITHVLAAIGTPVICYFTLSFSCILTNKYILKNIPTNNQKNKVLYALTNFITAKVLADGKLRIDTGFLLPLTAIAYFLVFVCWWELYQEPFVSVYGRPPRGYIQFGQVLSDTFGLCIYYCVSFKFKKYNKSLQGRSGSLH